MVLPALTEATGPLFRPIKYSLFPPLGLAALAAHLPADTEIELVDEHVMPEVPTRDTPPQYDFVLVQSYITNAHRAYVIADHFREHGIRVLLGGLHATSLPEEARPHADHLFLGPGDATFPAFLADLAAGTTKATYDSRDYPRTLANAPRPRRDLIRRDLYFVPNSIVVTRGCPFRCSFCYKEAFFEGGKSFYTSAVDDALAEISSLPGRHLYFLDDHLLGDARFSTQLFAGMRGMNRVFQAAATIDSVVRGDLIERAVEAGLRSLFVGFESVNAENHRATGKVQNLRCQAADAINRLHQLGVKINGSFVFGLDADKPDVFGRTVDWAVRHGLTTATFHIATPYPGTKFYRDVDAQGRLLHHDWRLYDTRHAVFRPAGMTTSQLEHGYWQAYDQFYSWANVVRSAGSQLTLRRKVAHVAYAAGWKKLEPMWNGLIRLKQLAYTRPVLENILSAGHRPLCTTRKHGTKRKPTPMPLPVVG
jgi:radical SAM superfamily enzyme YgiQ (UPF0313 family)